MEESLVNNGLPVLAGGKFTWEAEMTTRIVGHGPLVGPHQYGITPTTIRSVATRLATFHELGGFLSFLRRGKLQQLTGEMSTDVGNALATEHWALGQSAVASVRLGKERDPAFVFRIQPKHNKPNGPGDDEAYAIFVGGTNLVGFSLTLPKHFRMPVHLHALAEIDGLNSVAQSWYQCLHVDEERCPEMAGPKDVRLIREKFAGLNLRTDRYNGHWTRDDESAGWWLAAKRAGLDYLYVEQDNPATIRGFKTFHVGTGKFFSRRTNGTGHGFDLCYWHRYSPALGD